MTTVLKITDDDFDSALDAAYGVLKSGGVIIYPTDTVYGIGGDADSEDAVKKIHEIKKSDPEKPLSVMVGDYGTIDYYCETGIWEDIIVKKYLPGPYTFILKRHRPLAASKNEKLGVRLPDNLFCQYLAQKFGRPIITTSANVSGEPAPKRFEDIPKEVIDQADLAIDGGPSTAEGHSVIIDLVEHKLLRKGAEAIDLLDLPER
jgi:tRNA threonylcarbamoyl adenosine modification protein (Sua5/YciO/YrdC/YwlC family)